VYFTSVHSLHSLQVVLYLVVHYASNISSDTLFTSSVIFPKLFEKDSVGLIWYFG
jgi:hypothetical protein